MSERYLTVRMDLTDKCNLRCTMCYFRNGSGKEEISPTVFGRIAKEVFPAAHTVYLSCGAEPLMSKNFVVFLQQTRAAGVPSIQLVTNGTLLSDRNIEALISNGVEMIEVSLDGTTAQTYESIRVGAKLDRVVNNLRRLRDAKVTKNMRYPILRLRWIAMARNLAELPDFLDMARELDAEQVGVQHLIIYNNDLIGETLETDYLRKQYNQSLSLATQRAEAYRIQLAAPPPFHLLEGSSSESKHGTLRKIRRWSLRQAIKNRWRTFTEKQDYIQRCFEPWHTMYITYAGIVFPCPAWENDKTPMGDFTKQSFLEIWDGDQYSELRLELRSGNLRECCRRCPIYYGGTPWR